MDLSDTRHRLPDADESEQISLLDVAAILAESWRTLVVAPLLIGCVALGVAFAIPPTFTATTRLLAPQQQGGTAAMLMQQLGSIAGLAGGASALKNPADQYVALMKSRTVAERLVERFGLRTVYEARLHVDALNTLAANTAVSAGRDGLITVEVEDTDPQRAAELANAYVEALRELMGGLALGEAAQRRQFFEKQLQTSRDNLARAQRALGESGAGTSLLRVEPRVTVEAIARMQAAITAAEVRASTLRGYMADSNPDYRLAQQELAALRQQLANLERSQQRGPAGDDYVDRYREYKYQEVLFELMARQYELARVDESREGALVQVVDPAVAPERKTGPRKALIAIGATLAGGVAAIAFVLLRRLVVVAAASPDGARKLARIRAAFRWRARRSPSR